MPLCVCVCACVCVCVRAHYLSSVLLKAFPDSSVGKKKKICLQSRPPPPRHFNPFHIVINCFPHWSAFWKGWLHWFSSNTQQPAKAFELGGALPLSVSCGITWGSRGYSPGGRASPKDPAHLHARGWCSAGNDWKSELGWDVSSDTDTQPLQHGQNCPKFHF